VTEEDVFGRDMLRPRDKTSEVAGLPVRGKLRLLQRLSHRVLRLAGRPEGIGQECKVEDLAGRDAFSFGVIVGVHVIVWIALETFCQVKRAHAQGRVTSDERPFLEKQAQEKCRGAESNR